MRRRPCAFTIVELLIVVAIIALLMGILLPAIGKARETAMTTQSLTNLRNLAAAAAAYETDWGGRQYTNTPDDFGQWGDCPTFAQENCAPPLLVGWDGTLYWGLWIGSASNCLLITTTCENWYVLEPNSWDIANESAFGLWRGPSVNAFNNYVGGRYYDKIFWAPKDKLGLNKIETYLQNPNEFTYTVDQGLHFPTYCWSPAAMWAPDVMAGSTGWIDPIDLPGAWRSPSPFQASFPELKTRLTEHLWLQNTEAGLINPGFADGETGWTFNQGYNSAPATLFYDGHVSLLPVASAMASDEAVRAQQASTNLVEKGLWVRDTPLGANGYFGNIAYDEEVDTSFHVLTTDGILGRDTIRAR